MKILQEDFKPGQPVASLGADFFNTLAKFYNRLIGIRGARVNKEGEIPTISLDLANSGEKTTPAPTKGISAHPDYYDYPDKQAHPDDPAIVFPDWQRYYDMPNAYSEGELVAEHVPPARLTGDDNETPVGWERGKTAYKNGHKVGDKTDLDPETGKPYEPVGLSMTVITHMRQLTVNGAAKYQAMFSRMEFDENGLLVRVVPCSNWYTMM